MNDKHSSLSEGLQALVGKDYSKKFMRTRMAAWIAEKQNELVLELELLCGAKARRDEWVREENGGGGITCVIQDNKVFEKAAVNISIVHGSLSNEAILKMRNDHSSLGSIEDSKKPLQFFAAGISSIIHPTNPHAPTAHMNYRFFDVIAKDNSSVSSWFGGGADLSPSVLYKQDAVHFHKIHKNACDAHDSQYYPQMKAWCDRYFRINHRNENRGIGGIFFDDLDDKDTEILFEFIQSVSSAFIPAYIPILNKRIHLQSSQEQRLAQSIRRSRYVEFNLLYDRGTSFGLRTPNARIESILCSMPLNASWIYDYHPSSEQEQELYKVLKSPIDWV